MLKVEGLHVYYGAIHAVKGIDIEIPEGSIVTLIGANGAGKSSTIRAVSGLIKSIKGKILSDRPRRQGAGGDCEAWGGHEPGGA